MSVAHPARSTAPTSPAPRGQTILEVAAENGIEIPTLCHLDGSRDVGACRLCLVEVGGSGKLLPACVTAVDEGMEVDRPLRAAAPSYRRMIVELLFAERNHICSVCVANGHCELQDLAAALGHRPTSSCRRSTRRVGIDASHPLFGIDHNRCILCTRCVRVCDEIEGAHTWDVMGRGIDARVITDLAPALGRVADLHLLRQVRAGLPDRGAVREGPHGRRDGAKTAPALPSVPQAPAGGKEQ